MNMDTALSAAPLLPQFTDPDRPSALYPAPHPGIAPLRIGLLVDGDCVPAWAARIVTQIEASGFAQVVLVVVNGAPPRPPSRRARLREALYRHYVRRDIARRRGAGSAFHACALRPLIADAEWLTAAAEHDGAGDRLPAAALQQIHAARPDVLLHLGFGLDAMRGEILDLARHGVWSYQHGDSTQYRGGPEGFWEICERNPLTGTVLQRLNHAPHGADILYRSQTATHAHSLELSRNNSHWKASTFVMRCLRRLAAGQALPTMAPDAYDKPRYRTPGNARMLRFLGDIGLRKVRALIEDRRCASHWFVAWRYGHARLDPAAPQLRDLRELPCPQGHFYADPFLHRHRGQDWLFVEDLDYRVGKAHLAVIPWGSEGPAGTARTILDLDVHLSYPFVFDWGGETYLMPESASARRLSLFRARAFPHQWEFACDLLQGLRVVDATLHEHQGHWYLFANVCEAGGSADDELFLFHAPTPLGPFEPHPGNPIVSDVRRARSAGRLFLHEGRLIRPAQDCALRYGHAVAFNEVLELSPQRYRERPIGRLAPDWAPDLLGCHTYAQLDDIEVVDGNRLATRAVVGAPRLA